MKNGTSQARSRPREVEVAIVGAGFGGLCMGIQLLKAGRGDFVILEKGQEVGGTWRDNSYPGCACDVQSHLYSFSFAPKHDWSRRYAPHSEIQAYVLDLTEKHGLRPFIELGQEVASARFDEAIGRWQIRTKSGLHISARYWVLATGPLHHPSVPKIPGLDRFEGEVFHSARWNHQYPLEGKRVASIGTGGSAIQYVPEIAPKVSQLHVMQRSPAWVIPRDTRQYASWEKALFAALPALRKLHRARLYWTNESRVWPIFNPRAAKVLSGLAARFIRSQVDDPVVAEKLTPDYTIACKRVLISNDWLPAFNRSNVELVTEGIQEVRKNSIVTVDGVERDVDCIILGTGFVVDPRHYLRDFELTGLGGRHLQQDWQAGAEAYLGVSVAGFPNQFQLLGPNTVLGHNSVLFMIEAQVRYILSCLDLVDGERALYLDVKADAQREFNEEIQSQLSGTVWASGCQSWYLQDDGKNVTLWPYSTARYWLRTRSVNSENYRLVGSRSRRRSSELTPSGAM